MTLRLSIENVGRLPDGRPPRIEVKDRGLDFGRDTHLDWTLPDGSRLVSGKHCEIRFKEGGYWLRDVSTNGTFVNGSPHRLDAPYLLHDGDRLTIGPYIISVSIQASDGSGPGKAPAVSAAVSSIWGTFGQAEPPDGRAAPDLRKSPARSPDFPDFDAFIEPAKVPYRSEAAPQQAESWLNAPAAPPVEITARPVPAPYHSASAPSAPSLGGVAPTAALDPQHMAMDAGLFGRIARAAAVPEHVFAGRDPNALADEIGWFIRLTAQNLAQMLSSRAESKTLMRSSNRTMVRAIENNPLKFATSLEEALTILFGAPTRQYMGARATIESSFSDLKMHQVLTYGAMQAALDALFEDLAPERIDSSIAPDRGLGRVVASRKARLWDLYVDRWRAKAKRADGRLLEAFMALFAEAYDRLQERRK
jgi:type VI secretion system protein ImpI